MLFCIISYYLPLRSKHTRVKSQADGTKRAVLDKSKEWKELPDTSVWDYGVETQINDKSYVQHTVHRKLDRLEDLLAKYLSEGKPKMGLEKFRQAWPYYLLEACGNECVCTICTRRTSNREVLCVFSHSLVLCLCA